MHRVKYTIEAIKYMLDVNNTITRTTKIIVFSNTYGIENIYLKTSVC